MNLFPFYGGEIRSWAELQNASITNSDSKDESSIRIPQFADTFECNANGKH